MAHARSSCSPVCEPHFSRLATIGTCAVSVFAESSKCGSAISTDGRRALSSIDLAAPFPLSSPRRSQSPAPSAPRPTLHPHPDLGAPFRTGSGAVNPPGGSGRRPLTAPGPVQPCSRAAWGRDCRATGSAPVSAPFFGALEPSRGASRRAPDRAPQFRPRRPVFRACPGQAGRGRRDAGAASGLCRP